MVATNEIAPWFFICCRVTINNDNDILNNLIILFSFFCNELQLLDLIGKFVKY